MAIIFSSTEKGRMGNCRSYSLVHDHNHSRQGSLSAVKYPAERWCSCKLTEPERTTRHHCPTRCDLHKRMPSHITFDSQDLLTQLSLNSRPHEEEEEFSPHGPHLFRLSYHHWCYSQAITRPCQMGGNIVVTKKNGRSSVAGNVTAYHNEV